MSLLRLHETKPEFGVDRNPAGDVELQIRASGLRVHLTVGSFYEDVSLLRVLAYVDQPTARRLPPEDGCGWPGLGLRQGYPARLGGRGASTCGVAGLQPV
jgi:hypothetical protein